MMRTVLDVEELSIGLYKMITMSIINLIICHEENSSETFIFLIYDIPSMSFHLVDEEKGCKKKAADEELSLYRYMVYILYFLYIYDVFSKF